ncbi:MAG: Amuc_1100 family pilus-like protein [Candidatus Omnitrophica bacterium]|nr:Amuc_1100 family pilus-like protein [Candidatus Omnitrophota bacterium]
MITVLKKNYMLLGLMAILIIGLLLSLALFLVSFAKSSKLNRELSSKYEMISTFVERSKVPLSEESIKTLASDRDKLKEIYEGLKPLVEPYKIEGNIDPLYFKELLIQVQKKLRSETTAKNIILPNSLGFKEYETELSRPEEIPDLVNKLKILEDLVRMTVDAGVKTVTYINFDDFEDLKREKEQYKRRSHGRADPKASDGANELYAEVPVSLDVQCSVKELLELLYKMRASSHNFVISKVAITAGSVYPTTRGANQRMLDSKLRMHSVFVR